MFWKPYQWYYQSVKKIERLLFCSKVLFEQFIRQGFLEYLWGQTLKD